jgi:hypothetical protein
LTGAWSKGKTARHDYYFFSKRCGAPSIKAYEVDFSLVQLLKSITPKKECLDAFIALLRSTYYKRVASLQKRKDEADGELKRLQGLRQALVEKILAGIYSDEIFREQNKLIEEQIITIQLAKDDALLAKYNLEDIIKFMKSKFDDLGRTYQEADMEQIKFSSIFLRTHLSYPGYSNPKLARHINISV